MPTLNMTVWRHMTHHPLLFRCHGLCSKHCINYYVGFPRYSDLHTEGCDFLVADFTLQNQWNRHYVSKHCWSMEWCGERNNRVMLSTRWGLVHSSLGLEWESTVTFLGYNWIISSTNIKLSLSLALLLPILNLLKTKRRLLYLKTQFVPRSKHFSSRL
jgi:hypothetical protein